MDLLFVGGVGCPSPGWWVIEQSPSHGGEVLSRGGGGGVLLKNAHGRKRCTPGPACGRRGRGGCSFPFPVQIPTIERQAQHCVGLFASRTAFVHLATAKVLYVKLVLDMSRATSKGSP